MWKVFGAVDGVTIYIDKDSQGVKLGSTFHQNAACMIMCTFLITIQDLLDTITIHFQAKLCLFIIVVCVILGLSLPPYNKDREKDIPKIKFKLTAVFDDVSKQDLE